MALLLNDGWISKSWSGLFCATLSFESINFSSFYYPGTWNCPICVQYPKGYADASAQSSTENTSQNSLDPRLQAAALCDALTDYEAQLIRKALHRPPDDTSSATLSDKKPRFPYPKRKTGVLVQKTLINWTVKVENKQKSGLITLAYIRFSYLYLCRMEEIPSF